MTKSSTPTPTVTETPEPVVIVITFPGVTKSQTPPMGIGLGGVNQTITMNP